LSLLRQRATRLDRTTFTYRDSFVPNIASAKKNMRKSRAATVRNRAQRSALRTALKKAQAPDATAEQKVAAASLLDRAARKGLIHKNNAARHKSQIARATAAAK
jgi:small subunit ribosomal protein S20